MESGCGSGQNCGFLHHKVHNTSHMHLLSETLTAWDGCATLCASNGVGNDAARFLNVHAGSRGLGLLSGKCTKKEKQQECEEQPDCDYVRERGLGDVVKVEIRI